MSIFFYNPDNKLLFEDNTLKWIGGEDDIIELYDIYEFLMKELPKTIELPNLSNATTLVLGDNMYFSNRILKHIRYGYIIIGRTSRSKSQQMFFKNIY